MMTSTEDVLIVEMGAGNETIGILVHVDVVHEGDITEWKTPPFEGRADSAYIRGRGAVDDKGPVMMSLYAMKAVRELGAPLRKRVRLIVGSCEETVWTDMEHYLQEFDAPDYGFSPDGEFPIYYAEKGYCDVELVFSEPGVAEIVDITAGDSPNTIPSRAIIETKAGRKSYRGKAAHSSTPALGRNAIELLCKDMNNQSGGTRYYFAKFTQDFLSDDSFGGKLGFDDDNFSFSGDVSGLDRETITTAVPTILEKKNGKIVMNLNIRQAYGVTKERIEEMLRDKAREYRYDFIIRDCMDGIKVEPSLLFLRHMRKAARDYGCDDSLRVAAGTSYAKSMKNFVSWGPEFPHEESGAHTENEKLSIDSMMTATGMYALFLASAVADDAPGVGVVRADTAATEIGGEAIDDPKSYTGIEKALHILDCFTKKPYAFSARDIAKITGFNRTTVYRDISILETHGLLIRDSHNRYSLGPQTYVMGNIYLTNGDDREHTLRILKEIERETGESVGLARREGDKVMSIYAVENHSSLKMNDRPGTYYPMNKGTYGKCLMAFREPSVTREELESQTFEQTGPNTLTEPSDILAEYKHIRAQGFALSVEETFAYVIGVGVPLRGTDGEIRNVVAVSFFKTERYLEDIEKIKRVLFRYRPELEKYIR
jgi:succinyl-diaminopimelate desuccinylase